MESRGPLSPIRILRIVTRLNIGGPSLHVGILSTRLDPARFCTIVVTGAPDAGEGNLRELVDREGVTLIELPSLQRALHPWRDVVALTRLIRVTFRERPHIIHTHMAKAGSLGRLAGIIYNTVGPGRRRGQRARLVHTFHGHVLDGYFSPRQSALFATIERFLARSTDHLIAVSRTVCRELQALGIGRPEQWHVVRLGLDLEALAQLPARNGSTPVTVGMVGRLVPIKHPSLFLQALASVPLRERGLVRAMIVGDGPLRPSLEAEAEAHGLRPSVTFAGWRRDLPRVYGELDIACLTSWNEGTPVSLIEAMAAGRPVIATDVGGVADLLDDGESPEPIPEGAFRLARRGLLVRPGDAAGLAAALERLASDPQLRARLGETGREYVLSAHSSERLVREIEGLYEGLRADSCQSIVRSP